MRYEECGFYNLDKNEEDEEENREVAYMSRHIKNAEDFLNFRGFKSPMFIDTNVTVKILYDDMRNNTSLMMNNTNGAPEFVLGDD